MSAPTKAAYLSVANTLNTMFETYDHGDYKPRVLVLDTSTLDEYHGKWSLCVNNEALGLINEKGVAQDAFYADEVYTFTERDGTDYDMYIEPVDTRNFSLEKL